MKPMDGGQTIQFMMCNFRNDNKTNRCFTKQCTSLCLIFPENKK